MSIDIQASTMILIIHEKVTLVLYLKVYDYLGRLQFDECHLKFSKINPEWQGLYRHNDHKSGHRCGLRVNVVVFCRQLPDGALLFTGWVCFQVTALGNTAVANHAGIALLKKNRIHFSLACDQHCEYALCRKLSELLKVGFIPKCFPYLLVYIYIYIIYIYILIAMFMGPTWA